MATLTDKTVANTYDQLWFRGTTEPGGTTNATQVKTTENDGTDDLGTPLYLGTARIGIGTSSPSVELDVVGGMKVDSTTLVVDASNNRVGMGTASPSALLELESGTPELMIDATSGNATITLDAHSTSHSCFMNFKVNGATNGYIEYDHDGTGANDLMHFEVNDSKRLSIKGDGKVGIGTVSPDQKLDIEDGDIVLTNSDTGNNHRTCFLQMDRAKITAESNYGPDSSSAYSAGFKFSTYNYTGSGFETLTPLVIQANGKVGIGITDPWNNLEVGDTGTPVIATFRNDNGIDNTNIIGKFLFQGLDVAATATRRTGASIEAVAAATWVADGDYHQPTDLHFYTQDSSTGNSSLSAPRMTIQDDGNVGIGVVAPTKQLEIAGRNDRATLGLVKDTSDQTVTVDEVLGEIYFGADDPTNLTFQYGARIRGIADHSEWGVDNSGLDCPARLSFETAPNGSANLATRMTIGSEGNVGIGTSSPSVLLEIDGNQSSNGTIELARFSAHQGNAESTGLSIKGMTHSGGGANNYTILQSFRNDTSNSEILAINPDGGKVGIGTATPLSELDIATDSGTRPMLRLTKGTGDGNRTAISNQSLGELAFMGYGNAYTASDIPQQGAGIASVATGTWGDGEHDCPANLYFSTQSAGDGNGMGAARMVIDENGKVGIGANPPLSTLHIKTANVGTTPDTEADDLVIENSTTPGLSIISAAGGESTIFFGDDDSNIGGIKYYHGSNKLSFRTNNVHDRMVIDSSGNVGIGADVPSKKFHVSTAVQGYIALFQNTQNDGNAHGVLIRGGQDAHDSGTIFYLRCMDNNDDDIGSLRNTAGTFDIHQDSDRRFKKDIVDTTVEGLNSVNAMKVRDFKWKESNASVIGGFIADELQSVYPQAVHGDPDAVDGDGKPLKQSLTMNTLTPVLVKAIQELSAEVEKLKNG